VTQRVKKVAANLRSCTLFAGMGFQEICDAGR
jgi:hypothetical protein